MRDSFNTEQKYLDALMRGGTQIAKFRCGSLLVNTFLVELA